MKMDSISSIRKMAYTHTRRIDINSSIRSSSKKIERMAILNNNGKLEPKVVLAHTISFEEMNGFYFYVVIEGPQYILHEKVSGWIVHRLDKASFTFNEAINSCEAKVINNKDLVISQIKKAILLNRKMGLCPISKGEEDKLLAVIL